MRSVGSSSGRRVGGLVALLLPLTLALGAPPSAAAPIKVPARVGEQPFLLEGRPADARPFARDKGFAACAQMGRISAAPVLEFTLEGGQVSDEVEITLEGANAVLSMPNRTHTCLGIGKVSGRWFQQKGTYQLYAAETDFRGRRSSLDGLKPTLRFQNVRQLRKGLEKLLVEVPVDFRANPVFGEVQLPSQERVGRAAAGLESCTHNQEVRPAITFTLPEVSSYRMAFSSAVVVVGPDGACLNDVAEQQAKERPAGRYKVWQLLTRDTRLDEPFAYGVVDAERTLQFPDAPTAEVTATAPTTGFFEHGRPAAPVLGCAAHHATPIVVLRGRGAPPRVTFFGKPYEQVSYLGPLESSGGQALRCRSVLPESLDGSYAVFVEPREAAYGRRRFFHVGPLPEDPLTPSARPAADLPLAEREVDRYFAYFPEEVSFTYYGLSQMPKFGTPAVDALFAAAPRELFVFAASGKGGLVAGEPLLLVRHGDEKSTVRRLDGSELTVRTSALATAVPDEVVIAVQPTPVQEPPTLEEALALVAAPQLPLVDKLDEAYERFATCYNRYRAKHDPTWGESYDLVNLRTGQSVSSKWHKRADAACGWKKHQALEKKTKAAIVKSRNDDQKRALAAVRKLGRG